MKILIAEDEQSVSSFYKIILEKRGHNTLISANGQECVNIYIQHLREFRSHNGSAKLTSNIPFDAVILDHQMPKMDGMEAARRILAENPSQRVIFASAYIEDTLTDLIKNPGQVVELLHKPFGVDVLIDTVEDRQIYDGLKTLNARIDEMKKSHITHEEVRDLYEGPRKLMKGRI